MWMEKILDGVLRVLTPLGPRYIKPSFYQRIYLLWVFRNFHTLPVEVLSSRQKRLIDHLCQGQRFVSSLQINPLEDAPILGTLERRPSMQAEDLPPRRPNTSVARAGSFAADVQQRS
jgi:hypothetical protein